MLNSLFSILSFLDGTKLLSYLQTKCGLVCVALILGALNSCGLAPVQMWPLTIIAFVFFMMYISVLNSAKKVFCATLIFWGSYATISLTWLNYVMEGFGQMPSVISYSLVLLLSVCYIALPYAILNAIAYKLSSGKKAVFIICFMPLAFILSDFYTGWFLTGLPWVYVGYSGIDGPLKNFAPFIGVRGISALIYVLSAALALTALRRFLFLPIAAMILVMGIFTEGVTQVQRLSPIKVSLVQGNIPQSVGNSGTSLNSIIGTYWSLSKDLMDTDKLVVWPESALPFNVANGIELIKDLDNAFKNTKSSLVTGVFSSKDSNLYNSIIAIGKDADTDNLQPYNKRALVPFGEVVPFASLLRPLGSIFVIPNSSFSYGDADQKPLNVSNLNFTPAICYEAIFPETVAHLDTAQTNGIMMLSNDTWFGPTQAPMQHFNMARMRSMELQKPMLRDTNSGITAYIDELGNVVSQLETDKEGVLNVEFYPVQGQTIYSKLGNTILYVIMLLLVIFGCIGLRSKDDEVREQLNKLIRP